MRERALTILSPGILGSTGGPMSPCKVKPALERARNFRNPPQPHMCIQDYLVGSAEVSYINVLSWNKISTPRKPLDPIPLYGGMRVPHLSSSTSFTLPNPRSLHRRSPVIFAVMVNPEILRLSGKTAPDPMNRDAFVDLMIDFVEAMNPDIRFQRRFTVLHDRDLTGELKDIWLAIQLKREREKEESSDKRMEHLEKYSHHEASSHSNPINSLSIPNESHEFSTQDDSLDLEMNNLPESQIENNFQDNNFIDNSLLEKTSLPALHLSNDHIELPESMNRMSLDSDSDSLQDVLLSPNTIQNKSLEIETEDEYAIFENISLESPTPVPEQSVVENCTDNNVIHEEIQQSAITSPITQENICSKMNGENDLKTYLDSEVFQALPPPPPPLDTLPLSNGTSEEVVVKKQLKPDLKNKTKTQPSSSHSEANKTLKNFRQLPKVTRKRDDAFNKEKETNHLIKNKEQLKVQSNTKKSDISKTITSPKREIKTPSSSNNTKKDSKSLHVSKIGEPTSSNSYRNGTTLEPPKTKRETLLNIQKSPKTFKVDVKKHTPAKLETAPRSNLKMS